MKNKWILALIFISTITSCDIKQPNITSSEVVSSSSNFTSEIISSSSSSSISSSNISSSSSISSSVSSSFSSSSTSIDNGSLNSYYRSIDFNLKGKELKTRLHYLIDDAKSYSYNELPELYRQTDYGNGYILDIYSNCKQNSFGSSYKKEGDILNREHIIPQSVFYKKSPMRSDLFHVLPTDGYVNNRRSNYPHAEVSNINFTSTNGTKVGSSKTSGVSGSVCEPADEYKGDVARIYFYFATRYEDKFSGFKSYACFANNSYPSLSKWAINLYKKWDKEDPISQKEIKRNEAVYKLQKNRNPFVDIPNLADLIW